MLDKLDKTWQEFSPLSTYCGSFPFFRDYQLVSDLVMNNILSSHISIPQTNKKNASIQDFNLYCYANMNMEKSIKLGAFGIS